MKLKDSIIYALLPSYKRVKFKELREFEERLNKNPSLLFKAAKDIKYLTDKRVEIDRKEIKKKLSDLDRIVEKISKRIFNILKKVNGSQNKIKEISVELQEKEDDNNIKDKLLKVVVSMDEELESLNSALKEEDENISLLKEKIKLLEYEIEKLSKQLKIDYLTGIGNRQAMEEELEKREAEFIRYGRIYSVVFFDVDHFKRINDTYGHLVGDCVLREIGRILRRNSRIMDFVGRYGGEEFVAILPSTDLKGAFLYAKKIKNLIKNHDFKCEGYTLKVTISGGVASRNEVNSKEEILKLADERLYMAKRSGRDKVCANECE
jgi:diguanylate cyclase (GGDEF)-like protein